MSLPDQTSANGEKNTDSDNIERVEKPQKIRSGLVSMACSAVA